MRERGPVSTLVFVYGTLMRGRRNHRFLRTAHFLGPARVKHVGLYQVSPAFPGAVREQNSVVRGELYQIDEPTLAALDRLEDEGYLYKREMLEVVMEEAGVLVKAWVYLWRHGVSPETAVPLEEQPWCHRSRQENRKVDD